jgi:hypothetical protein
LQSPWILFERKCHPSIAESILFPLIARKGNDTCLAAHTAAGTPKSAPPVQAACSDQIDITLLKFPDELSIVAAIPIRAATSSGLADKVPRCYRSRLIHCRRRNGICQTAKCYGIVDSHQKMLMNALLFEK